MSFLEVTSQPVVRVPVGGLGFISPTQPEAWSSAYQLVKENLALSLVRQSVVVLKLQAAESELLRDLQVWANSYLFDETQSVPLTPAAPTFQPLPGARHLTYQPGTRLSDTLFGRMRQSAHDVFGILDVAARLVLRAVCRSANLRLHSSTMDTILDEFPLHDGNTSSSTLEIQHSVPAAAAAAAEGGELEIKATASEEMVSNGLVTIISTTTQMVAAGSGQHRQASMLQVKDREGKWINVPLLRDEVAVVLGATAHHATAGVLRPAAYRMVGEFHLGAGHKWCAFHLNARPSAVLAFQTVLEEAGHFVAERFRAPMTVDQLIDTLDAARTAARNAASSARSTTCMLKSRAITPSGRDSDARPKRMAKKRPASEMEDDVGSLCLYDPPQDTENIPPSSPTRSHSARHQQRNETSRPASGALAASAPVHGGQQQSRPNSRNAATRRASRDEAMGLAGPAPQTPSENRGRTAADMIVWTTLDLQGATGRNVIQLIFINSQGVELYFKASAVLPAGAMFESYADRMGADLGSVAFMHQNTRIFGGDTPAAAGLKNFDVIRVVSTRTR